MRMRGPTSAERMQVLRVPIICGREPQFRVTAESLGVKLGNIAAADDGGIHAAFARVRDRRPAQCRSTLLTAATMSSMSLAVPRKTFCGVNTISLTAWSATGVGNRRKYSGRFLATCRIASWSDIVAVKARKIGAPSA